MYMHLNNRKEEDLDIPKIGFFFFLKRRILQGVKNRFKKVNFERDFIYKSQILQSEPTY